MKTITASKTIVLLSVLGVGILGGTAYQIIAAGGGAKGTPTSTANNLRQPAANGNGLVAWYPMDGDAKDFSGNHNDGTLTNFTFDGTTNGWTGGKFGKGLLFNGSNNYVSLPSISSLALTSTSLLTVSAWINQSSQSGNQNIFFIDGGSYYQLETRGSTIGVGRAGGSFDVYYSAPSVNVWHYIVATYNQGSHQLFIDGSMVSTGSYSVSTTGPAYIGMLRGQTEAFGGSIDDVRIYNRALSAPEIQQLYAGSPPANCDQTCKVWLKFDDNTGTTASDISGSGMAGTITGTTAWTTGNFASAVSLNGTTGYVSVPNLGLASGTVDMWVYPNSVSGDQRLFAQGSGASTQAGQIALNQASGENGSLWVWDGGAWQRLAADGTVKAGQWNQIVVCNNGSTATAYVNGTAQLTASAAFAFSGPAAYVGGKFLGTTGGTFNGSVDDFRVYTRMLMPEEVADQWRQGT